MTSLVKHPSFKLLIDNCFADTYSFDRKVNIGNFFNKHLWNLKVEIEECANDVRYTNKFIFMFRCFRENNLYQMNDNLIYEQKWIVPNDYEYIIKYVDYQFAIFCKKIHQINQCIHCGKYIYDEIAFEDKCFSCGLQCIYNTENSDYICSICRDPVGFGYYKKCKNNHLMHTFCFMKYNIESNKNICPYRCGSIIE